MFDPNWVMIKKQNKTKLKLTPLKGLCEYWLLGLHTVCVRLDFVHTKQVFHHQATLHSREVLASWA